MPRKRLASGRGHLKQSLDSSQWFFVPNIKINTGTQIIILYLQYIRTRWLGDRLVYEKLPKVPAWNHTKAQETVVFILRETFACYARFFNQRTVLQTRAYQCSRRLTKAIALNEPFNTYSTALGELNNCLWNIFYRPNSMHSKQLWTLWNVSRCGRREDKLRWRRTGFHFSRTQGIELSVHQVSSK